MSKKFPIDVGGWGEILAPVLESQLFDDVMQKVERSYMDTSGNIIPTYHQIWRCFRETPPEKFKVLILGQDPYPNRDNATGLAFGIPPGQFRTPPSLKNILEEVEKSYDNIAIDFDYTLETWAGQGVLLLNSALTVADRKPGSYSDLWAPLIQSILEFVFAKFPYHPLIVFGRKAERLITPYTRKYASVCYSPHPAAAAYGKSPGAVGSNVFINANYVLTDPKYFINKKPIDWLYEGIVSQEEESDVPF